MKNKPYRHWLAIAAISLTSICVLLALVSTWTNARIPTQSAYQDRLGPDQLALLVEAANLRQALGNSVFPGFGDQDIPFVVYNEQYAFAFGLNVASPGWKMVPSAEVRGGEWEAVPLEEYGAVAYFRTPISDPAKTPESFIVQVGEMYAASFQTREYGLINLTATMKADMPPLISAIIPYRLIAGPIFTDPEAYIGGLMHESFHAYQARQNPEQFGQSERIATQEANYPFNDEAVWSAWKEELKILSQAGKVKTSQEARELAAQFLTIREGRYQLAAMTPVLINYERKREWLEGLAKYVELETGRAAAVSGHVPLSEAQQAAGLKNYSSRERFWFNQVDAIDNTKFSGETLFYYSGLGQAVLLDHLLPGWKELAIQGAELDPLLARALE